MKLSSITAGVVLVCAASASVAAPPPPVLTPVLPACASTDISTAPATFSGFACVGYYEGNLLGGSPAMNQLTDDALNLLMGTSGVDYSPLAGPINFSGSGPIDFSGMFGGTVVLGIHKGGASQTDTQGTAFYKFTLSEDVDSLTYNLQGLSNASLFFNNPDEPGPPPVPEPGTYALMLAGLGAMGLVARRRSRKQ